MVEGKLEISQLVSAEGWACHIKEVFCVLRLQILQNSTCYPESSMYGCEHENDPRKVYCEVMSKEHESFSVAKCGVASPDGTVLWEGNTEIKCPYLCKDKALEEGCKGKSFCLQIEDGNLVLKKDHM